MGRPGADRFIDHGMDFLWTRHRDAANGGYVWGVGDDGRPQAGLWPRLRAPRRIEREDGRPSRCRPAARRRDRGAEGRGSGRRTTAPRARNSARDWSPISALSRPELQHAPHRGDDGRLRGDRRRGCISTGPKSIATLIIVKNAAAAGWQVPEHYDEDWQVDRDYAGGDVFRPYGVTPGHALEWTRLVLQLWELGGRRLAWLPEAAKALFRRATARPAGTRAAAASSIRSTGTASRISATGCGGRRRRGSAPPPSSTRSTARAEYEDWYRRIWDFVAGRADRPRATAAGGPRRSTRPGKVRRSSPASPTSTTRSRPA